MIDIKFNRNKINTDKKCPIAHNLTDYDNHLFIQQLYYIQYLSIYFSKENISRIVNTKVKARVSFVGSLLEKF